MWRFLQLSDCPGVQYVHFGAPLYNNTLCIVCERHSCSSTFPFLLLQLLFCYVPPDCPDASWARRFLKKTTHTHSTKNSNHQLLLKYVTSNDGREFVTEVLADEVCVQHVDWKLQWLKYHCMGTFRWNLHEIDQVSAGLWNNLAWSITVHV